jgi:hypothetical protein
MPYLKRTDGQNAAGAGRTITGASMRRGDDGTIVFVADEQAEGDTPISQEEYEATLAANIEHNRSAPLPQPDPPLPTPEPPLSNDELKRLRALLD